MPAGTFQGACVSYSGRRFFWVFFLSLRKPVFRRGSALFVLHSPFALRLERAAQVPGVIRSEATARVQVIRRPRTAELSLFVCSQSVDRQVLFRAIAAHVSFCCCSPFWTRRFEVKLSRFRGGTFDFELRACRELRSCERSTRVTVFLSAS